MKNETNPKVINPSKKEVQIKFITELNDEFKLNVSVFSLPLEVTPTKLNELLQKLLKTDKTFSFFINQIKLTTPLSEFINKNILSTENVIEIFYMLEINEPQHTNTIKEDEWIKRIQILKQMKYQPNLAQIYTVGLFNGDISFYSEENKKLFSLKTDENNTDDDNAMSLLTDLKYFKKDEHKILIRTMKNYDKIFELFDIDIAKQKTSIIFNAEQNNNEFYNSIDINPFDFEIISFGGMDSKSKGVIDIYSIPNNLKLNEKNTPKKRKIEKQKLTPIKTFRDLHNTQVEYVAFLNKEQIISTGDDFSINLFNLNSNSLFLNYNTNFKRATCLQPFNAEQFIVGFQDGTVKLYDSRIGNKSVMQFKDKTVCGFISDICFNPDKDHFPNVFASTGYDGGIKLWDIRAGNEPLKKIEGMKDEKNYSVKFNGINNIIYGGNNSSINILSI